MLSLRPLKWLRFVAFAALGAKGDFFDGPGPDSNIVSYKTASDAQLADSYYYSVPDGRYRLAYPQWLNDCVTSSAVQRRLPDFCHHVAQRDGDICAVTGASRNACDAAHIIPHSEGTQYIKSVVSDRRSFYEDQQSHLESLDIDSTQNGIFLRVNLHRQFGPGQCMFLKAPNFPLSPADIPRVEPGETPASRTTIQYLVPYAETDRSPMPQWDILADWSGEDAPPNMLFDYVYGIAAIRLWATTDIQGMLKSRYETDYKNLSSAASPKFDTEHPKSPSEIHHETMESKRCRDSGYRFRLSVHYVFGGATHLEQPGRCYFRGRWKKLKCVHAKLVKRKFLSGWKQVVNRLMVIRWHGDV